jgi:hypothetical protein
VKVYCVWFPRLGGYMGKRGVVADTINNACWFWVREDAAEWADVLGGEVRLYEETVIGDALPKPEEPF